MKPVYLMRHYAEVTFGLLRLGQVVRTREFEHNWYDYKVVHIDDHTVILERQGW